MSEKAIPIYGEFVRKLFNRSGDPSKDFTHAILGIVTEIHEYLSAKDEVNGLEELGDLAFYLVALAQVVEDHVGPATGFTPDTVTSLLERIDQHGAAPVIADVCNSLLDDAKRWVGYGKEPKSLHEVLATVTDLVVAVNLTGPYPCEDMARLETTNMRKLLKRYPGGEFSQYHAIVRDLDGERAVLESA